MQFLRVQIVTTVGQGRSGFVLLLPPPTPLSLSLSRVLAIRLKASGQTFISPVLSLNIFSTAEEEMRLPNRKKIRRGVKSLLTAMMTRPASGFLLSQLALVLFFPGRALGKRQRRQPGKKRALLTSLRGFGQNP